MKGSPDQSAPQRRLAGPSAITVEVGRLLFAPLMAGSGVSCRSRAGWGTAGLSHSAAFAAGSSRPAQDIQRR